MDAWWALPGPKALIDRMVHDLEDQRSVIFGRPAPGPEGAVELVASRWRPDWWRWLSAKEIGGPSPAETLIERFCPDAAKSDSRSLDSLLRSERVGDLFCGMRISDEKVWDVWKTFLTRLERVAKDRPLGRRPMFLIEVIGKAATLPLTSATTAVWHEWGDDISSREAWVYADSLLTDGEQPVFVRQVQAAVVSELALWDAGLAWELTRLSLDELFSPAEFLEKMGTARGWQAGAGEEPRSAWAAGQLGQVDGRRRWHSAHLAVQHRHHEIQRRIWHGQVAVLFPIIEDLKLAAANGLRRQLRPPFSENGHPVEEITHLELGSLWFYMNRNIPPGAISETLCEGVRDLRTIRNCLAHARPITAATLRDPHLRALAELAFSGSSG